MAKIIITEIKGIELRLNDEKTKIMYFGKNHYKSRFTFNSRESQV